MQIPFYVDAAFSRVFVDKAAESRFYFTWARLR